MRNQWCTAATYCGNTTASTETAFIFLQIYVSSTYNPISYWNIVKYLQSSLSWLGVSGHLWPLSPLTFSRGQRRSGVSGLAIVSNEQDSVCLILKTSWTDSSSTSRLQGINVHNIFFLCSPKIRQVLNQINRARTDCAKGTILGTMDN